MNRRGFITALAVASIPWDIEVVGAKPPVAPAIEPVGRFADDSYVLVKNWDFAKGIRDFRSLSQEFYTRYVYANGTLDHVNDEWQRYRENDNHVFTTEGLSLIARPVGPHRPGGIESGMLRSRWTGQCGIFEIRMKVPPGRGMWPAFWLNPQDGRWPPEIDVVEIANNGSDTTHRSFHFLHGAGAQTTSRRASKLNRHEAYEPGFDYAEAFHVFSVEWMPGSVKHFVDGILICDRNYQWTHDDASNAGPAHVLVNLAVGGAWPGEPWRSGLPAALQIGHIRVWQRRTT